MSAPKLTQAEKDYQLSRPNETSVGGLTAYRLSTLVIVCVAVLLRMWGRRLQKIRLRADDYILLVAAAFIIGYAVCGVLSVQYGYGHHTLIVQTIYKPHYAKRGKAGYVGQLLYAIGYPLSRISLVLLYTRIFVRRWFTYSCYFMIVAFCLYSIATFLANAFATWPISAAWDFSAKAKHRPDGNMVIRSFSGFNISSDIILLVLPLSIIWTLQMKIITKLAVSGVFCLGALTCIASVMRFVVTFYADKRDPEFSGAKGSWWLVTELHLGLLCPCLITFQPIFVYAYRGLLSRLSPHNRTRVTRFTGVDDDASDRTAYESKVAGSDKSGLTRFETSSVNSKPSDLEAQKLAVHDENALPPRLPASMTDSDQGAGLEGIDKDASDRVQDHDVALANLKPPDRVHHQERGMGSSVRAEADVDRRV